MPFKKGTSGNPVGRPKGSGNIENEIIKFTDFKTID